jgi:aminoglycoside phosphotransferase (APT) family kinase protein
MNDLKGTTAAAAGPSWRTADLVGRGFSADVYAWGGGRVLKLFHASVPAREARREYHATLAVARAGLPAPAVYDLVEVDGRAGIVMERIDGPSMFERVQARPWTLVHAARELADLHAQVHHFGPPPPADLPSQRQRLGEEIADSAALSPERKNVAADALAGLPDGAAMCHGDFHPANILYPPSRGGPVIIDWGRASHGHPLGDVAYTSRLMRLAHLPAWAPRYMHALLKCSRSVLHRAYLRRSLELHEATLQEVRAWEPVLAAAAMTRRAGGTKKGHEEGVGVGNL